MDNYRMQIMRLCKHWMAEWCCERLSKSKFYKPFWSILGLRELKWIRIYTEFQLSICLSYYSRDAILYYLFARDVGYVEIILS